MNSTYWFRSDRLSFPAEQGYRVGFYTEKADGAVAYHSENFQSAAGRHNWHIREHRSKKRGAKLSLEKTITSELQSSRPP